MNEKISKAIENLSDAEIELVLKQIQHPEKTVNTVDHFFNQRRTKFLVLSDPHIGSKYTRQDIFNDVYKIANKEKVEAIYIPGDIIEGMSNRDGHIYELETIGVSNQINQAANLLSASPVPLFFTTGNHDEWSKNKANQGHLVGQDLESRISHATFLGEYTANIKFSDNVTMRLTHEGATAYALSYSGQKRINALEGGTKPSIIMNGHLHKLLYMNYRNIHYFEAGTLQSQTPFMAMKGSPSMVGFWLLDVYHNKKGITQLKQTAFPYY